MLPVFNLIKQFSNLLFRDPANRRRTSIGNGKFSIEPLESRRLLAANASTPSIGGDVFFDFNGNSTMDAGEEISGASVELYRDNGDGAFNPATDTLVDDTEVTDAGGEYCFDNLVIKDRFFVVQPAQTVNGVQLSQQVSPLISPTSPGVLIDMFDTTQVVEAQPPAPNTADSSESLPNNEAIGGQRDITANLISGPASVSVEVNPFGLQDSLQYNANVDVTGSTSIVWDGVDNDPDIISTGLNGVDLTNGGINTGITMLIGAQMPGSTARVRLFQGNNTTFAESSFVIPTTSGGSADAYQYMAFSGFSNPTFATNVDAIELFLDSSAVGANDIEVEVIGANGVKVANFVNQPEVDLSIEKTDGADFAVPGNDLTYTITVRNLGPIDVTGATVVDMFPAQIENVTYSSATTGGASGNTASGSASINDTVDMPNGSTIVYTVTGSVESDASGNLANSATVTVPRGFQELNPGNNVTVDIDTLTPQVDLRISKSDDQTTVIPGDDVTYSITVVNDGPSDVVDAVVQDQFPPELSNVTFTSAVTGTVTGNSASGSGSILDTVSIRAGSTITYTVTGRLSPSASGQLTNTATVTAPQTVLEVNSSDNSAVDIDAINREADLSITKTDGVTSVAPGESITYTMIATNLGPSEVVDAMISDSFPNQLSNITYTSTTTGGAISTSSGNGDINDSVTMPAGSTITYLVNARVNNNAIGMLANVATISAPSGVIETNNTNNAATDIDAIVPEFDLTITKTDNRSTAVPGEITTYLIVVANSGPNDVTGAVVRDTFPSILQNVSYSSSAAGGASNNTAVGNGAINDTLNLPANSSVTYSVTGRISSSATGSISNTATVAGPSGLAENNLDNNSATDTDTLTPQVDLEVTKTNNTTTVAAGDNVSYTIEVSNHGPSDAIGVRVSDDFPSQVTNANYSSAARNGATGHTVVGTGDINDLVNLPTGSSITYAVNASIPDTASGTITNNVTVSTPANVTEINNANNASTESDTIEAIVRSISGNVYVDLNSNGVLDAGEPPIPNVQLTLNGIDRIGTAVTRTTQTNNSGSYVFADLVPGTYSVRETQPAGFNDGQESVGTGSVVNPTVADDLFSNIQIGNNNDGENFNFGESRIRRSKRDLLASTFQNG